jgi:hypothetical protein
MGLLGDLAKGKPFAEDKPVTWDLQDDDKDATQLVLPGNVTISYSSSSGEPIVLKVGHVMDDTTRRVVRRCFSSNGPASIEYDYSTETKT